LLVAIIAIIVFSCGEQGCIKRSSAVRPKLVTIDYGNRSTASLPNAETNQPPARININTASSAELETLPGIGKGLAERIIEHRERFGRFRKAEHLIIVRGISDKRFRALQDLITVE
jgi:competence protein ComEA